VTDAYREDLAFIHESGHAQFAANAAQTLLELLPSAPAGRQRVVDLGCGGGTLAESLAQNGVDVVGYDISPAMIDIARGRVPEATFEVASFLDVQLPECFAVTAVGEVFNYLLDERYSLESLRSVLERIYAALQPGGLLLFDVAGPGRAEAVPRQMFRSTDDWSVLVENSCEDNVLTRHITSFRRVGEMFRRDQETHRIQLFDPAQVRVVLEQNRFDVEECTHYGDLQLPAGGKAFVARKPKA